MESAHFTTAMGGFLLLAMQVNTIFTGDRYSVGESVVHFSESLAVVEGCCLISGACGGTIIMVALT